MASLSATALLLLCLCAAAGTATAGRAPWCGRRGGAWRQLPPGGNVSATLRDAIVANFLENQQANNTFSPCEEEEPKTTIQGCIRSTANATDFRLWITLACPMGKSEVAVGLLVEATEPEGDAQPEVLDVDVLWVKLDGKKVQGRDALDGDFFPEARVAAPRKRPQKPAAAAPEAAPAPEQAMAPDAALGRAPAA